MAIQETIKAGKKLRRYVDGAWERLSFWHKASDCEFDDGMNAQEKLGDIKGITASTNVTNTGYAADAKVVGNLYQNLTVNDKQFIFDYQDGKFGYNTDPGRHKKTFNSFDSLANNKMIKLKYDRELTHTIEEKFNLTTNFFIMQIKLKLKKTLQNSEKVQLYVEAHTDTIYSLSKYFELGKNASRDYYKTVYDEKTNILTVNLLFPDILGYPWLNPRVNIDKLEIRTSPNGSLRDNFHYNSEILEVSFIDYCDRIYVNDNGDDEDGWYNLSMVNKVINNPDNTFLRLYGRLVLEGNEDFKFGIEGEPVIRNGVSYTDNVFTLSKDTLYHNGLKTVSSGSNLVWYDGSFYIKSSSSKRYKNSIEKLSSKAASDPTLNPKRLYDLDVVSFRYNSDYLPQTDQRYQTDIPGFIAEDVYQKYPIACHLNNEGQPEMWDINILFPAALKLIQEQHEDIEMLKKEIYKCSSVPDSL